MQVPKSQENLPRLHLIESSGQFYQRRSRLKLHLIYIYIPVYLIFANIIHLLNIIYTCILNSPSLYR